jgi:retron-type reverse transcriptase
MKLDFSNFFNSLKVSDWRLYAADYFPDWTEDEIDFSSRILFWGSGTYTPKCLAIGSPTSPALSNALMYDVDVKLADFANRNNVKYTRYADDITFSSENFLNYNEIISEVKNALKASKYTNVTINNKKTILISNSSSRRVTGLIITPNGKISLGRERKRLISSMAHHYKLGKLPNEKRQELSGLLAFALDAEPEFIESLRKKYTQDVIDRALKSTVEGFVT